MNRVAAFIAAGTCWLAAAHPTAAAELTSFSLTSRHVAGPVGVTVLLPDGYDARRRFPVLYLLHGYSESHGHWSAPTRGDISRIADGLGAVVVMPDQRDGYSVDHYNNGERGGPAWTRFFFADLAPEVERRFAIRRGRRWHAIAGASMGGYGAVLLASQRPGHFGTVASFSGLLSMQRPEVAVATTAQGTDYERMFGPLDGPYAEGHNPPRLAENLAHSRVLALVGDGVPGPGSVEPGTDYPVDRAFLLGTGSATETAMREYNEEFAAAAAAAGVPVELRVRRGVHDWPDFRRSFSEARAWGLFEEVPSRPRRWTYRTIRQHGVAWGLSYRLTRPPERLLTLRRHGRVLAGEGDGTVRIRYGRCRFTATLPFRERCREAP